MTMRWIADRLTPLVPLAGIALAACGGGDSSPGAAPRAIGRPNVVIVQTDDQDARSLGVMHKVERLLAAHGATFTDYHVTTPECCPSRATLLTGQYAHNHGVVGNERPDGGFAALDGSETLPVWLRRDGYVTAHFGRYLNGYGNPAEDSHAHQVPRGWDVWESPVLYTDHDMYGYVMNENGRLVRFDGRPRDYETDVIARDSERFVQRASERDRPFFLSVDTLAPHQETRLEGTGAPRNPRPAPRDSGAFAHRPLPHPPSFDERDVSDKPGFVRGRPPISRTERGYLRTLYRSRLESLLAVDDLVGGLVATLRRTGELRRTLIVFTSDNGFMLGEHRLSGKFLAYEESSKVPLVVRGPGVPAGIERGQLTANIDLAPTILALTGAQPGLLMDGRSLLPALKDPGARVHRAIVIEETENHPYAALRMARYVYVDYADDRPELYDLQRDPYELRNLAREPRYTPLADRLRERLAMLRNCRGRACD
jgi:arylsulfatase A-like enzyme